MKRNRAIVRDSGVLIACPPNDTPHLHRIGDLGHGGVRAPGGCSTSSSRTVAFEKRARVESASAQLRRSAVEAFRDRKFSAPRTLATGRQRELYARSTEDGEADKLGRRRH